MAAAKSPASRIARSRAAKCMEWMAMAKLPGVRFSAVASGQASPRYRCDARRNSPACSIISETSSELISGSTP